MLQQAGVNYNYEKGEKGTEGFCLIREKLVKK